jgi:hypothetical protein
MTNGTKEDAISQVTQILKRTLIREESGSWFARIVTHHTVFQAENMAIDFVEVHGRGDFSQQVLVVVYFRVNKSCQARIKRIDCENVEDAIKKILEIPQIYVVCIECGAILSKSDVCQNCEFFKAYGIYHGLVEQICAICQEQVYRTKLGCGHMFHYTCLTKLDPVSVKCPVCRTSLSVEEVEDIFYQNDDDDDEESNDDD